MIKQIEIVCGYIDMALKHKISHQHRPILINCFMAYVLINQVYGELTLFCPVKYYIYYVSPELYLSDQQIFNELFKNKLHIPQLKHFRLLHCTQHKFCSDVDKILKKKLAETQFKFDFRLNDAFLRLNPELLYCLTFQFNILTIEYGQCFPIINQVH